VDFEVHDFASIMKSETLEVVEITHLTCEASEYLHLCENIRYATSLRTLDLSHVQFFNFLVKNVNRREWDNEPNLYNKAALALCKAIVSCSTLQDLKLIDCGIKQAEIKQLIDAILRSTIMTVNLSNNGMLKSISKDTFFKIKTQNI